MIVNDRIFENQQYELPKDVKQEGASEFNMDKVKSTLRQFAREWSAEGKEERDQCYKPILDAL